MLRKQSLALLAILGVGLLLRLWGLGFGLPYDVHPDEHQYVEEGLSLLLNRNPNPQKFNNPSLLKYTLAAEYGGLYWLGRTAGRFGGWHDFRAFWYAHPEVFYLLGRLTTVLLGVGSILVLYHIGRETSDRKTGLVASALLSATFLHARDSHFAVNDIPVTFLALVSLRFALRIPRTRSWHDYVLAAFFGGLAASTKYTGGFVVLCIAAAHLVAQWRQRRWATLWDRRLIVAAAVFVLAFLLGTPFAILDAGCFWEDLVKMYQRGSEGYKGIIIDPDGGYLFYLKSLLWGMGYGLLAACLLGLAYVAWKRPGEAVIVAIFPVAIYLFMGRQLMFFARFIIPAIPFLILFAAYLLCDIPRFFPLPPLARALLLAGVMVGVVVQPTLAIIRTDRILSRTDTRTLARLWIEAHAPDGSRIIRESNGPKLPGEEPPSPPSDKRFVVAKIPGRKIGEHTLEHYRANYDYLVVNSFQSDLTLTSQERARQNQAVYDALDRLGAVAVFAPYRGDRKPPFVFDQIYGPITDIGQFERPGPKVRIYRLQ